MGAPMTLADLPALGLVAVVLLAAAVPVLVLALMPTRAAAGTASVDAAPDSDRRSTRAERSAPRWAAPAGVIRSLERNLRLAGLEEEWTLRGLLIGKIVGGALGLALAVLLVAGFRHPAALLVGVALLLLGYLLPDVVVASRARRRQELIERELPDTLDQILIAIEAGLGLEAAVARAGRHGHGPLARELVRTVQDMRVGMSRKDAYTALADRTTVPDLRRFARAIMQADRYGVSVGNVVRTQASELRAKRRQRAEERAMRVPVLVLFPLMFCILPVLFIVVLAPALVNLIGAFADIAR